MGCSLSSSHSSPSLNDFVFYEKIGEGGFASIYRSYYKPTNSMMATKIINIHSCCSRRGGQEILRGELEALKAISSHPFVIQFHSAFHSSSDCYLTFELTEGGDLRSHLNTEYRFTEKMVAYLAGCIGSALRHVHSCGVLHRDVKPENILFDVRGVPKLIDFGVAFVSGPFLSDAGDTMMDSPLTCTLCSGTRLYSAPELFTPSHAHGAAADFWSLGMVLFEMLFLAHPFRRHCPREFMKFATKYSAFLERCQCQPKRCFTQMSTTVTTRRRCEVLWIDDVHANSWGDHGGVDVIHRSINISPTHHQRPSLLINELPRVIGDDIAGDCWATVSQMDPNPVDQSEEFDSELLPSHLHIHIPPTTAYGDEISSDCFEFLDELFDIRHDRRLGGTEVRYGDFVRHSWLQAHGVHIPHLVKSFIVATNTLSHATVTATGPHCPSGGGSNSSALNHASPIKLNHEALRALILKRQTHPSSHCNPSVKLQLHKQKLLDVWPISGLNKPKLKPHHVLPQDYHPEVLDILDSYHFPVAALRTASPGSR
jgi:serine/threonine protein kinase